VHDDLGVGNAVALACAARAIDVVLAQSIPDALLALERIVFELLVLDLWVSDERGERAIEYLEFIPACPRVVIWSDSIDTLDLDSLCVPPSLVLPRGIQLPVLAKFLEHAIGDPLHAGIVRFSKKYNFSRRQIDILGALVAGARGTLVSKSLSSSPETVRVHLHRMFERAQCYSQSELVAKFWHWFAGLQWPSTATTAVYDSRTGVMNRDMYPRITFE